MYRMPFYAVRVGHVPGVYTTWEQCKAQVDRFSGAQHKSFKTKAEARSWIAETAPKHPSDSRIELSGSLSEYRPIQIVTPTKISVPVSVPLPAHSTWSIRTKSVKSIKTKRPRAYIDGACPNNGAAKTAGVGIYFPSNPSCSFGEALPDELAPFTNNRAEIYAAIRALEVTDGPITLYTDSKQVVNTMTKWLPKRILENWVGIKNTDLYLRLLELTENRDVKFKWVPGHSGVPGNEAADQLATQACQG